MKKKLSALALALVLALSLCLTGCGGSDTLTLNVYNWGEYISDGSDGSLDTIHAFEDWYESTYGQKVKVNYSTYASNEDLYAKLKSGAVSYDVIIPSDYMIARLKDEGMLQPLNFDNIPNYQHIHEGFQGLYYDPDNQYSVPYTYGVVGIIYDANQVDPADAQGWDLMWNEKYAGKILQFNNSRDAFGTAMYKDGLDVNTTDKAQWDQALQTLLDQRPLVKGYVMDEIFNSLESGEPPSAPTTPGTTSPWPRPRRRTWTCSSTIPNPPTTSLTPCASPPAARTRSWRRSSSTTCSAEEPAVANAEYISYASPNALVYESETYQADMGQEAMEILYPDLGDFAQQYNTLAYRNLSNEMLDYVNTLWETLKIN